MNLIHKLKRARRHIARGWIRGEFAMNSAAQNVGVYDRDATAFCSMGAMLRAEGRNSSWSDSQKVESALLGAILSTDPTCCGATGYNDHRARSAADVLKVFTLAIERLKGGA